jgi:hypothetical protein
MIHKGVGKGGKGVVCTVPSCLTDYGTLTMDNEMWYISRSSGKTAASKEEKLAMSISPEL